MTPFIPSLKRGVLRHFSIINYAGHTRSKRPSPLRQNKVGVLLTGRTMRPVTFLHRTSGVLRCHYVVRSTPGSEGDMGSHKFNLLPGLKLPALAESPRPICARR